MGNSVRLRVKADITCAAVKPKLSRLMEEYGKFVRLAATRRDAEERSRFAKKAEDALKELDALRREAQRLAK